MATRKLTRAERERQLREMLNDPERRPELDEMFYQIIKERKISMKLIEAILDHEYPDEDER